jgi:hypothetical protein
MTPWKSRPNSSAGTAPHSLRTAAPNLDEKQPEEALVRDPRAGRRPAEMVESKLLGMLRFALVPVSQIRQSARGWSRMRA